MIDFFSVPLFASSIASFDTCCMLASELIFCSSPQLENRVIARYRLESNTCQFPRLSSKWRKHHSIPTLLAAACSPWCLLPVPPLLNACTSSRSNLPSPFVYLFKFWFLKMLVSFCNRRRCPFQLDDDADEDDDIALCYLAYCSSFASTTPASDTMLVPLQAPSICLVPCDFSQSLLDICAHTTVPLNVFKRLCVCY